MRRARQSLAEMVSFVRAWTETLTMLGDNHLRTGYSFDLSDEDAIDLGRRSIYAAGHRDVRFFSLSGRCPLASPPFAFLIGGLTSWDPHAQAFSGNTINLYSEYILSS